MATMFLPQRDQLMEIIRTTNNSRPHTASFRANSGTLSRNSNIASGRSSSFCSRLTSEISIPLFDEEHADLPPIAAYRKGLCRSALSTGIAYALPSDPGPLASQSNYRVDLRAMFQDPYRTTACTFHDDRLRAISRLTNQPNRSRSAGQNKQINRIMSSYTPKYTSDRALLTASTTLPLECRTSIQQMCSTGPINRDLLPPSRLQLRSKLNEPVETQTAGEIHNRARSILADLNIKLKDDFYDNANDDKIKDAVKKKTDKKKSKKDDKKSSRDRKTSNIMELLREDSEMIRCQTPAERRESLEVTVVSFPPAGVDAEGKQLSGVPEDPCEELPKKKVQLRLQIAGLTDDYAATQKTIKEKMRPQLPQSAKSSFLDETINQKIWDWLTEDDVVKKFDYFMFVCDEQ